MSMELIDRKKIRYSWFEVDGKCSDGVTLQSVIKAMPTVKAIPIEVVEQIREHFEAIAHFNGTVKADYVLNMLDKAIKEQS